MAPIVADCLQVSLKGVTQGHTWAVVNHFQLLGASPPDPEAAAQIVIDSFADAVMPQTSAAVDLVSADYADLSSLSGISGSVTPTGGTVTGGSSGIAVPPNAAVLVTKNALGTRSQRNGRMYLVGVEEAATTSDGALTSGAVTLWQNALDDWTDALQDGDLGLVVLSKSGPSAGDVRTVTSLQVQSLLATQRRRLRR